MPKHQRSQKSYKKHTKASKKSLRKATGGYIPTHPTGALTNYRGREGLE